MLLVGGAGDHVVLVEPLHVLHRGEPGGGQDRLAHPGPVGAVEEGDTLAAGGVVDLGRLVEARPDDGMGPGPGGDGAQGPAGDLGGDVADSVIGEMEPLPKLPPVPVSLSW